MRKQRSLEGEYAGFASRVIAFILDTWIVGLIISVTTFLVTRAFDAVGINAVSCQSATTMNSVGKASCVAGVFTIFFIIVLTMPLYYALLWTLVSQTIGQRVLGLRVMRLDGADIGFRRSLVRYVAMLLCVVAFGIPFLWVLVNDRRMGWHDIAARTCVVYAWKARENDSFIARVNRRFGRKQLA